LGRFLTVILLFAFFSTIVFPHNKKNTNVIYFKSIESSLSNFKQNILSESKKIMNVGTNITIANAKKQLKSLSKIYSFSSIAKDLINNANNTEVKNLISGLKSLVSCKNSTKKINKIKNVLKLLKTVSKILVKPNIIISTIDLTLGISDYIIDEVFDYLENIYIYYKNHLHD